MYVVIPQGYVEFISIFGLLMKIDQFENISSVAQDLQVSNYTKRIFLHNVGVLPTFLYFCLV